MCVCVCWLCACVVCVCASPLAVSNVLSRTAECASRTSQNVGVGQRGLPSRTVLWVVLDGAARFVERCVPDNSGGVDKDTRCGSYE